MIDRAGRSYAIRADGTRANSDKKQNSARPLGYEVEIWARLSQSEKDKIRRDLEIKMKGDIPKAPHKRIGHEEDLGTGGASSSAGVAAHTKIMETCTGVIDACSPWKQPSDISDFYDNCGTTDNEHTSVGDSDEMNNLASDDSSWDENPTDEPGDERSGNANAMAGPTFWMKDRRVVIKEAIERMKHNDDASCTRRIDSLRCKPMQSESHRTEI
jgi:hypothetical protein